MTTNSQTPKTITLNCRVADIDTPIYIGIKTLKQENLVDHVPEQFRTMEFLRQKREEKPGIEPSDAPYENRSHELNWLDTGCDISNAGITDLSPTPEIASDGPVVSDPLNTDGSVTMQMASASSSITCDDYKLSKLHIQQNESAFSGKSSNFSKRSAYELEGYEDDYLESDDLETIPSYFLFKQ